MAAIRTVGQATVTAVYPDHPSAEEAPVVALKEIAMSAKVEQFLDAVVARIDVDAAQSPAPVAR